jgi:Sec-independent protein translocase protein TatA
MRYFRTLTQTLDVVVVVVVVVVFGKKQESHS